MWNLGRLELGLKRHGSLSTADQRHAPSAGDFGRQRSIIRPLETCTRATNASRCAQLPTPRALILHVMRNAHRAGNGSNPPRAVVLAASVDGVTGQRRNLWRKQTYLRAQIVLRNATSVLIWMSVCQGVASTVPGCRGGWWAWWRGAVPGAARAEGPACSTSLGQAHMRGLVTSRPLFVAGPAS
jgi:hypothetical protein